MEDTRLLMLHLLADNVPPWPSLEIITILSFSVRAMRPTTGRFLSSRFRKGLVIINTGTGAEGKVIFSSKNSKPIQVSLQIFRPHPKIFQKFISQHVQAFYVLIIFKIFKNPIKNRFKKISI